MTVPADQLRACLVDHDIDMLMRLWRHVMPHLPQPANRGEATVALHIARTQTESLPVRLRYYSHRWLLDNGYPSSLPDQLKPLAERLFPRVAEGVGVSYRASGLLAPIGPLIQGAMSDAVLEAYADRRTEPAHVKQRMRQARRRAQRELLGPVIFNQLDRLHKPAR